MAYWPARSPFNCSAAIPDPEFGPIVRCVKGLQAAIRDALDVHTSFRLRIRLKTFSVSRQQNDLITKTRQHVTRCTQYACDINSAKYPIRRHRAFSRRQRGTLV